ncbi:tyrosine-type recombinase/integrase [Geobacillus stearothermophilus]|nr:tyrosine-type recombinase/integrase [Geobacillus stearothermophilus]MED3729918.1 tyrosine-type recombinase/integrase [Geobacillus stearothermophilus]MED3751983.1 tyrosine-type recombinase/integrase [Geobacillus stearothermophilus]MED3754324.1 tyrosine-type recombinase/integrase [Geobacillus stearothermophilus]MED3756277.1 tyrosine-type recombinase/integrase [Geobacillus stearothermophilus]MED3772222.1 tyrosine-type recombinase/integrase [Geobacillus stearothermophilus]
MNFDKLIKEKKKGFYFRIDVGKDPVTGKRKQASFGPFRTKTEAKKELLKIKNQVDDGSYFKESTEDFSMFMERWFNTSYKRTVEITTAKSREYVIRNHIMKYFQHKKINEITTFDIDSFYVDKLDSGYSGAYIRQMHNLLNQAFDQAVRWSLVKVNPVKNAKPPKVKSEEKITWTVDEVNRFLNLIKDSSMEIPYLLAIFTGMRRGEVLGLKWDDVDFENKKIRIKRSLCFVSGKGLIFKEPKTKKSKRQISISQHVVNVLKKHKQKQEFQKEKLGTQYQDNNLIVCTDDGKPLDPRNLLRQFYRLIEEASVPRISFHDLWHTHATILMQQGENPKVVSERLGHSRVGITLDLYSHVSDDLQEQAAEKFENALLKQSQNPLVD